MRKYLLAIGICCLGTAASAQSTSLGINGGVGHSWIKNYNDVMYMPHGNFGISLIHSTKSSFGFGADLKYSFEGGKEEARVGNINTEHTTNLHYVRLPIKAIWFFGDYGNRLRPKIHAGPSLGLLVSAQDKVENADNGTVISDVKTDDNYNNFDIGITAGAGLHYRLVKNTWFTADLNYYNSFRDIRQANSGNTPRLSNNNVALNIGVQWGL